MEKIHFVEPAVLLGERYPLFNEIHAIQDKILLELNDDQVISFRQARNYLSQRLRSKYPTHEPVAYDLYHVLIGSSPDERCRTSDFPNSEIEKFYHLIEQNPTSTLEKMTHDIDSIFQ